jgi:hypothetical protein
MPFDHDDGNDPEPVSPARRLSQNHRKVAVTLKPLYPSYYQFPHGAFMAPSLRFFFAASIILLVAARAPAQRITFHGAPVGQNSGGSGNGGFNHNRADSGWGSEYPSQPYYSFSHSHHFVRASAASEPGIGYAHGDANFVPSVYMDYDKALALGKRILEEQSKPQPETPSPSLGDVARALRRNTSALPSPATPTISALQDNRGQLLICGLDVTRC